MGMIKFHALARVHDQHAIGVDDRFQPMRYRQHRAMAELLAYRFLDEFVGGRIHVGRRLVQYEDSVFL